MILVNLSCNVILFLLFILILILFFAIDPYHTKTIIMFTKTIIIGPYLTKTIYNR